MNIKNKIIIIVFTMVLIAWWAYWLYMVKNNINSTEKISDWTITDSWDIVNENVNESKPLNKKNQIGDLKKKLALKWLIIKWDISQQNGDYTSALVKYLQINKELPNDKSIILKIGDVYSNLKKFDKAYHYYSQIKNYEKLDKNLAAKTLFSSVSLSDKNILYIKKELKTLWLSEQQLYYYNTSIECKINFSECRKEFQDYFDKRKNQPKVEWTWSNLAETKFDDLEKIWTAIDNYKNFQVDDLNYKWALIAWVFFENWLYPIAIETSKAVLKEKNDYKPLIKIIAKSYFELWNYIQAKLYLIEYSNLVQNDSEMNFFLWVVYEKLREYILSTIHLNNALKNWYKDKLDVYKRIVFNYFELWEMDKMLVTFNLMLSNSKEQLTINDYSLAIYYNLLNDKTREAKEFTTDALKKYPESEIINWYMWWILMDEANKKPVLQDNSTSSWSVVDEKNKEYMKNLYAEAGKYIDKWLSIDSKSPMLNLVKWKLEFSKWEKNKAFLFFRKTVSIDWTWEFWKMAEKELKNIQMNK